MIWKGLEFSTYNLDVYPPKPASLLLAEVATRVVRPQAKVLDACTGCGVVAIAVAKFVPQVEVCACDSNLDAITVTKRNAKQNEVRVAPTVGDLYAPFPDGVFDVITVHPPAVPYSPNKDWGLTAGMKVAADGGVDGSLVVSRAITEARRCLSKGGTLLLLLPHWSNVRKARSLLRENYIKIIELGALKTCFFPLVEGRPDDDVVQYARELAERGTIELAFQDGKTTSTVSVIQAIK